MRTAWLSGVPAIALFALVPKCPFCLLGYLSLVGLGSAAAFAHPLLRGLGFVLGAVAIGSLVLVIRSLFQDVKHGSRAERL